MSAPPPSRLRASDEADDAVVFAVGRVGEAVASSALVVAFASLMISGVSSFVQIGFALAAGIVMSAFLLGLTMVPALTAKLGDRMWWPSRMGRSVAPAPAAVGAAPG